MSDLITMTCPNCGGKLEITSDVDHFVCAYCGTEHVVKRFGDSASLRPVVDGTGTSRTAMETTASELVIARLSREIAGLKARRLAEERRKSNILAIVFLACVFASGILFLSSFILYSKTGVFIVALGPLPFAIGFMLVGGACYFLDSSWNKKRRLAIKALDEEIESRIREIEFHRTQIWH